DDDAADAAREPGLDGRKVANAAAELHRHLDRLEQCFDRRGVNRLAGEGAVEVDDVEVLKTLPLERARLLGRIGIEHRRPRHVALLEPDALAAFQIDCRKQNHGFHFRKLAISARPNRWLFSGWNCVPNMVSFATT